MYVEPMYVEPAGQGGRDFALLESNQAAKPSGPVAEVSAEDIPTGTSYYDEPEPTPSGESGPTVPISSKSESTPSSGTVPTAALKSGLLYELGSLAQANGYDPAGTYDGYEIGWFYSRTPSASGYVIGPTELGIGQTEKITLLSAAGKIASFLSGGDSAKPPSSEGKTPEDKPPGESDSIEKPDNWKQVAIIGGMILVSVILIKAIST
jgi:hypothetical protein